MLESRQMLRLNKLQTEYIPISTYDKRGSIFTVH